MSIIGSNILAGASGQAGYNLNNSLRFRRSATAYLSKTLTTPTNNKIWTWSSWVKIGILGDGTNRNLIRTSSGATTGMRFETSDTIRIFFEDAGAGDLQTTKLFSDPSAWYHIVLTVDTTQATAANRVKLYINGTQVTAFSTSTYPTQNYNTQINSAIAHTIGSYNTIELFDGYMTEINFVDGQALTPSSFGETSLTTGSWIPKKYTSTYGTNGFKLNFSDASAATAAAIGKDSSGNGNNWTPSGISVTAGVTYDAMLDVPTNTSATVANYATWNPLLFYSTTVPTITNGNLTAGWNNTSMFCGSTMTCSSTGKTYAEFTLTTAGSTRIGIKDITNQSQYNGGYNYVANTGQIRDTSDTTVQTVATSTNGDIIGIAVDLSANTLQFYKNNTAIGTAVTIANSSNWAFWVGQNSSATPQQVDANFGQRPFSYTAPSGFVALNTYNLPTPTILQGNKYMDATTYTGTGAPATITNAASFKPDFVWTKARSAAIGHLLYDSVRGATKYLQSASTSAEGTGTDSLTSFNTNGFSVGADTSTTGVNQSGTTYVGWQWQAGQGTTTAGTGTGGITSVTQSVSTTAGFSIVQFTASGSNGTVTHGLGVAPSVVIVKDAASAGNWAMYHKSLPSAAYYLYMNTTAAQGNSAQTWNSTAPTSSVFSIGTWHTADRQIAYCWAEIAGFSKAFSYTGDGSTDGSFVFCGFRPKFVLLKSSSTADDWYIHDSTRNTYNVVDLRLSPNLSSAEVQSAVTVLDFLSNGFKLRTSNGGWNGSGNTYIGIAFAENPFKNSNAR